VVKKCSIFWDITQLPTAYTVSYLRRYITLQFLHIPGTIRSTWLHSAGKIKGRLMLRRQMTILQRDSKSLSAGTSERPSWETPLEIAEESNTEESQGMEPLARTQRELLDLHNALIREAKLQGLAKYQVRL
jgi:hypothetical protein